MNTEIIAIIDRSGSMESIRADAIGGFNAFLAEQKAHPGIARMTTVLFDDQYEKLYEGKPIGVTEPLTKETFVPRGITALNDAIGRTLSEQRARIEKENWANKVIVCILTDGHENASREFSALTIKNQIEEAKKRDWHFVFLAANQDAFATGAKYGFDSNTTFNFVATGAGTREAYGLMSASVGSIRGVNSNNADSKISPFKIVTSDEIPK